METAGNFNRLLKVYASLFFPLSKNSLIRLALWTYDVGGNLLVDRVERDIICKFCGKLSVENSENVQFKCENLIDQ